MQEFHKKLIVRSGLPEWYLCSKVTIRLDSVKILKFYQILFLKLMSILCQLPTNYFLIWRVVSPEDRVTHSQYTKRLISMYQVDCFSSCYLAPYNGNYFTMNSGSFNIFKRFKDYRAYGERSFRHFRKSIRTFTKIQYQS